jgi:hypothetical protein
VTGTVKSSAPIFVVQADWFKNVLRRRCTARANTEGSDWKLFIRHWWQLYQDQPVKAADLARLAVENDLLNEELKSARDERSQSQRIAKALAKRLDAIISGFSIARAWQGGHTKSNLYRLVPVSEARPTELRSAEAAFNPATSASLPHSQDDRWERFASEARKHTKAFGRPNGLAEPVAQGQFEAYESPAAPLNTSATSSHAPPTGLPSGVQGCGSPAEAVPLFPLENFTKSRTYWEEEQA